MQYGIEGQQAALDVIKLAGESFSRYRNDSSLRIALPQVIRVGKAGGLPFDSVMTDLFSGCLPASTVCYGECFAARQAFEVAKVDFGKRVRNIVVGDVLKDDLMKLPVTQGFVRSGWNSDLSWGWNEDDAREIIALIHGARKHPVILTKAFTPLSSKRLVEFAKLDTELRICVSAFDTDQMLEQRIGLLEAYRSVGGLSVPVVMTAKFKDKTLMQRQDEIVNVLIKLDLPAAENSIRFNRFSPVLKAIDVDSCGLIEKSGDIWAGRIYPRSLTVPTLASVPNSYRGVAPYRSQNDPALLRGLFFDPVPLHDDVLTKAVFHKPQSAGVPRDWSDGVSLPRSSVGTI